MLMLAVGELIHNNLTMTIVMMKLDCNMDDNNNERQDNDRLALVSTFLQWNILCISCVTSRTK